MRGHAFKIGLDLELAKSVKRKEGEVAITIGTGVTKISRFSTEHSGYRRYPYGQFTYLYQL